MRRSKVNHRFSKRPKVFKGNTIGRWCLQTILGSGGNGTVWSAIDEKGRQVAIKLLRGASPKAYQRFVAEMRVLEENADVPGILPIYEKYLPSDNLKESPFYVMPVANTMAKRWSGLSLSDKIQDLKQIAQTLAHLHERSIAHRDIKPGNILFWKGRVCIADFGLVHYPDKPGLSSSNEEIGARWTMAPEMRRKAATSDPFKADVYSFGKLMWMVLTEDMKGFDGQYMNDSHLSIQRYYSNYMNPIEQLLTRCTHHDPNKRPGMGEIIAEIEKWMIVNENFHQRNLLQWSDLQAKLFPSTIPSTVSWTALEDIVKVLQLICAQSDLNHTLFPDHGGLDLINAVAAGENGCLELDFGHIEIVKPKRLLFESFDELPQWSYFRLELDEMVRCPVADEQYFEWLEETTEDFQTVTEMAPGIYYPAELMMRYSKHRADYDIPTSARLVSRRFKGTFVIVPKRSIYNRIPESYDARHNDMSAEKFRDHISELIKAYRNLTGMPAKQIKPELETSKRKFFIENQTVYQCGWCGRLLTEELNQPTDTQHEYLVKVINKYGNNVLDQVTGNCCKDKMVKALESEQISIEPRTVTKS